MPYQGVYLNLDRSTDRRTEIENELARVGLDARYQRLGAIDGRMLTGRYNLQNIGAVGCFLSHVEALKFPAHQDLHRHVIEDDTIFSMRTAQILEQMIGSGIMNTYDILYTDIDLPLSAENLAAFKAVYDQAVTRNAYGSISNVAFQVIDLRAVNFISASSYLVNKASVEKLSRLYEAEIEAGIRVPVDDFLRLQAQIGGLKIGCIFPFITAVRPEHALDSTIRAQPDTTRRFTAANIARYSFFIDCDWADCRRLINAHIPRIPENDIHAQILAQLLTYQLVEPSDPTQDKR